ncbi:MAG TPA: DUF1345 domain-containing protein [Acidimicrobiales bacterium]
MASIDPVDSAPPTHRPEPRWPASLAILVALLLHLALPQRLVIGPKWVLPVLEGALVLPLLFTNPDRRERESNPIRIVSVLLIALISLANLVALVLLVRYLIHGGQASGTQLIFSAMAVWLTAVIVFSLWFWELDGGGPAARHENADSNLDFLFPQQASPDVFPGRWLPTYVDYLYVSFTNSTAFSPTDTMPLTTWAKLLMMMQSGTAFITVALVAARAINILN